jgi:hypothetical protein
MKAPGDSDVRLRKQAGHLKVAATKPRYKTARTVQYKKAKTNEEIVSGDVLS